jgi:hypothetical protein
MVLGGAFPQVEGTFRNHLARLNVNGSLDTNLDPGAGVNGDVSGVAIQADGGILINGPLSQTNGTGSNYLARLNNDPTTQSLIAPDANHVQWLRGGAGPEVSQATFELSIDGGSTWAALGAGTRITGGWHLKGISLPESGLLRARGRTTCGVGNGSSGLVEAIAPFPASSFQKWKLGNLGDNTASDLDDADSNGFTALAEYGLAQLPGSQGGAPAVEAFDYPEGRRLRMFVTRDPTHNDVTVEVQAASDVRGLWTTVAASVLGAPFAGRGYVGGDATTPGLKTVEIRDTVSASDVARRFMRVRVTH